MLYTDLVKQYSKVKQLGNKILCISYGDVVGYNISSYKAYEPYEIDETSKVYTSYKPEWRSLDDAYDYLYGKPTAPDFSKVLAK